MRPMASMASAGACRAVHAAWAAWSRPRAGRFERALRDPEAAQWRVLRLLLRRNRRSAYGRRYGFASITSVEAYRARVPAVSYDELVSWIDRIRRGEREVLTREPVRRLLPTSGSTAACKLVPWTRSFAAEWARAIQPWIHDLFRRHPEVRGGPAYWSVSPALDVGQGIPSAVPVGFDGDSSYLGGVLGPLVRATLAVPEGVGRVRDLERFRYLTALGLLRSTDLRLVSVWHPSFFELILDAVERHWGALLRDVAGRDAPRARTLERVGPRAYGTLWPRLAVVSCWADGPSTDAAEGLGRRLAVGRVQPKGLLATEGVVTVPFGGARPVAVRSHFLEFVDGGGTPRTVADLREGEAYGVILTTGAGLYRYRLGDRVRVEGFLERTPCLRFLGKEDRVSDLRGEKLDEGFVAGALEEVLGSCSPAFAMLAPDPLPDAAPGYTLYVEAAGDVVPDLAAALDAALSANPHYRYGRRLGQLRPPAVFRVDRRGRTVYLEREIAEGNRAGDVKPAALSTRDDWSRHFAGAYEVPLRSRAGTPSPCASDPRIQRTREVMEPIAPGHATTMRAPGED